jgi:transposase
MAKNNALTPAQRKQMVADYVAGKPSKDICKKYGIKQSTINYWVNKLGAPKRTTNYSNGAVSIIPGERMRKCLKCGRLFQPYTFGGSSFHHICSRCWMVTREYEYQPLGFGRRV